MKWIYTIVQLQELEAQILFFALNIVVYLELWDILVFFCYEYIEPHNLLFLVATKVSFWFFLSLNINDPHNILFTGFLSLQFAKKCKQNCIKRAFRILWTLSIKLGTWYITLLLLPFLRDLCIRETYDVGRK